MGVRQYIGARYVPLFYENSNGTAEWESGVAYEPLTIVTYNNNSYTSRKAVSADIGDPSANPDYWAPTGLNTPAINNLTNRVTALENAQVYELLPLSEDASGAVNAAVFADVESGHHYIIRPGTYEVDAFQFVQKEDFSIIAEPGTILKYTGSGSGQVLRGYQCDNFVIRGLEIDSALTHANAFGFEFCSNGLIAECIGRNSKRSGVYHGGAAFAPQRGADNMVFQNCRGYNCTYGFSTGVDTGYTNTHTIDGFYGENLNCAYYCTDLTHSAAIGSTYTGSASRFTNALLKNCGLSELNDLSPGAAGDGTDGGVLMLYTANNVTVENVTILNEAGYGTVGAIIRGFFSGCCIDNIKFSGNAKYCVYYGAPLCIAPVAPRADGVSLYNEVKNIQYDSGTNNYIIGIVSTMTPALAAANRLHFVFNANIGAYSDYDFTTNPINNSIIAVINRFNASGINNWTDFTVASLSPTNYNFFW